MESARLHDRINLTIIYIILVVMAFIMIVPFAWMILTALKTNQEAISVAPFYILPHNGWHWENFAKVWASYNFVTLYKNTLLRGQCKSGELVCVSNYIMPSNYPKTNSLMKLYTMSSDSIRTDGGKCEVVFINPENAKIIYSVKDTSALYKFDENYLGKTLEEVQK